MEFSKPRLTPASQATFGRRYGKKQKNKKKLKNYLIVMKQILYEKKLFFSPIFEGECQEVGRGGRGSIIGEKTSWVKMTFYVI